MRLVFQISTLYVLNIFKKLIYIYMYYQNNLNRYMHCNAYLMFIESFGSVDQQAFRNVTQIESSSTNCMSPLFASNQKYVVAHAIWIWGITVTWFIYVLSYNIIHHQISHCLEVAMCGCCGNLSNISAVRCRCPFQILLRSVILKPNLADFARFGDKTAGWIEKIEAMGFHCQ